MLPYHSPTSTWTLRFEEEEARQGHGPSLESCLASLCPVHGLAFNRKGGPGVLGERMGSPVSISRLLTEAHRAKGQRPNSMRAKQDFRFLNLSVKGGRCGSLPLQEPYACDILLGHHAVEGMLNFGAFPFG